MLFFVCVRWLFNLKRKLSSFCCKISNDKTREEKNYTHARTRRQCSTFPWKVSGPFQTVRLPLLTILSPAFLIPLVHLHSHEYFFLFLLLLLQNCKKKEKGAHTHTQRKNIAHLLSFVLCLLRFIFLFSSRLLLCIFGVELSLFRLLSIACSLYLPFIFPSWLCVSVVVFLCVWCTVYIC